jgi:Na+-transporting NADH:ubiquinone oxidoreductase subunit A
VALIGKLFIEGKYDPEKVIALAGSEVKEPRYYRVRSGLHIGKLLDGRIKSDNVRVISGNVLTGEKINPDGYLGFYDNLISVIPEGNRHEFLGWMRPTFEWLSFHRAIGLLSFLNSKNKEYVLTTNTRGDKRAFVQTGIFEKVMPMDIYPNYLFKSIMAEDYDEMEALGIYEVIEEDVALCEFVDVSKHNLQQLVRKGLNLLQTS